MKLEIAYLVDHSELVPTLADWFAKEWGGQETTLAQKQFTEVLEGRMNRDQPPITFIGFLENEIVGTATLMVQEIETHPQYEHWLSSVYVRERYRRKGIVSEMIKVVIDKESQLEIDSLYLYTRRKASLYAKFGWTALEETEYRGKVVYIMQRHVSCLGEHTKRMFKI